MEIDFFFSFHDSKNEAYKKASLEKPKTFFYDLRQNVILFSKTNCNGNDLGFRLLMYALDTGKGHETYHMDSNRCTPSNSD